MPERPIYLTQRLFNFLPEEGEEATLTLKISKPLKRSELQQQAAFFESFSMLPLVSFSLEKIQLEMTPQTRKLRFVGRCCFNLWDECKTSVTNGGMFLQAELLFADKIQLFCHFCLIFFHNSKCLQREQQKQNASVYFFALHKKRFVRSREN